MAFSGNKVVREGSKVTFAENMILFWDWDTP